MNRGAEQPSEAGADANDELDDEPYTGTAFPIVGVGASAGGLEAFTQLLKALPADTGMAFVLVQHLAPSHPSALAEILSRTTTMPVREVDNEPTVEPNNVYVIPPDRSMIIAGGKLQLLPRASRGAPHTIDQFFRSLADEQRHQAIGVVLSGTATDGTLGLEAIKGEGGITFAQDATAQHQGMPHSAIASGCVDFVMPPADIAREIARISQHAYAVPKVEARETDDKPNLEHVLRLLKHGTGVDFAGYKFNTLYRRITRRMVFQKIDDLAEYVQFLQKTPLEIEALYQDILINVTSFFRDTESFEALKRTVFPRLLEGRSRHDPVRFWTLGCSTGQEAYSLAMAFTEAAETAGSQVTLQLFASDLNAKGIEKARAGVYPKDIEQDVSPERLRRFFTEVDGQYRVAKSIRDACIFSRHNVLADPPFSRIDVISCRNLLIYLEPVLQQKIMPTLHYALKPSGCLWLGSSETIGAYRNLFDAEDPKHKIYARKPSSGPGRGHFPLQSGGVTRAPFGSISAGSSEASDLPKEADRVLLTRFSPPAVLVSSDLEILQYRGDTSPYLAPLPGKASLSLLKMLREGLLVGVRSAVLRAGQEGGLVREQGLRAKTDGGYHEVDIEVIPINAHGGGREGGFLILFEKSGVGGAAAPPVPPEPSLADTDASRFEKELSETRDYLQAVIEQQEAANEELQSANEEVQSANEELQSTNEELETSKEEIQSSNEELATVNDELNNRNAELHRVNDDLTNLLSSIQTAIIMLGPDLRVRRYTPAAEKLLNLIPADVGRPLADIKLPFDDIADLEPMLAEVLDTVTAKERDVRDKHGRWYSLRLRPYRTLDNKIDGVVLALVDVDALKRANAFTEDIVATVREPLLVLDENLRVVTASRSFYGTFHVAADETENRLVFDLGNRQWDIPSLRALLNEVLPKNASFNDFEVEFDFPGIGRRNMLLNGRRIGREGSAASFILLAIEDVTERTRHEDQLRISEERFRTLADGSPVFIWQTDATGLVFANALHLTFLGVPLERAAGTGWLDFLHPDDRQGYLEAYTSAHTREEKYDVQCRFRRHDGEYRWFRNVASPYRSPDNSFLGFVGCSVDVTDILRAEALLLDADRRKNEFLAMLAHELRNPLAPIRNAVEILQRSGNTVEAVASVTAMMERQVGQMVHLVDDLLDVSRIGRGTVALRLSRLDLASVVHQAVEANRSLCKEREHEFTVTMPPSPIYLRADYARLVQVVGNILNNAFKFTDRGGRISLTVEREATHAVIIVRDSGIGIAAHDLTGIFEMFMQVDGSVERSPSGLGIGLALVKSLVQMHDGTIEARSAGVGQGTEFVVRLPIPADEQSPPESPIPAASTSLTACRILVVDDNRDAADSLAMLLTITGNVTNTVYTGVDAVAAAAAFRPDVVLLDIGLPQVSGYEVARRIREQSWGEGMTLFALTGWGQEEDRQKSKDAGFDGHLTKPVDFAELTKQLTEWLSLRKVGE